MRDLKTLAAMWYVGAIFAEDVPEIACEALEHGYDGRHLRYLAGLSHPLTRDIAKTVDCALQEMGFPAPITRHQGALHMAKREAQAIFDGCLKPYDGAVRIWLNYLHEATELRSWDDLSMNFECAEKTSEITDAEQQILQAAKKLLSEP
jgi:hypothetical protein